MTKPVTPQDMFDMWQRMVNPGAYPLQSLMFPVLDAKELEKKIAELEAVEHWLKANLNLLQLSIKSLEYQRALVKGGEKAAAALRPEAPSAEATARGTTPAPGEVPNPALWAWNLMAQASRSAAQVAKAAQAAQVAQTPKPAAKPAAAKRKKRT
jgi:hypothetical protein